MIKVITLLKRKSGMTLEEFSKYYFEKHGQLALKIIPPEITASTKLYVQNHAIKLKDSSEPAYDAVTESVFLDLDSMRAWSQWYFSESGKILRDDEDNFLDKSKRIIVVTEEKIIISNEHPQPIKSKS